MTQQTDPLPAVILLGGDANALSVARSLGTHGVKVFAIAEPTAHTRYSRYCAWISVPAGDDEAAWAEYLLGPDAGRFDGAVLLACSDAAIRVIATHRGELARRFRLDESDPEAQLYMLNKLCTYEKARAAGVPTPRFWVTRRDRSLGSLPDALPYPILVKPLFSHEFDHRFGRKFLVARGADELVSASNTMREAGIEAMLVEMIPGPDDRLCSYYTYLADGGVPLFHFTKRVIRRFPAHMGGACYHITDWNPEVRDAALKLFRHVGLRGLANAEFKRDERDGQLKLIECNARFTAANCLVAESGFDLGMFVYNRIVGRPQQPIEHYKTGLRLWYPVEDFQSFLELRQTSGMSLAEWVSSVSYPQVFPFFRWHDPLPTLVSGWRRLRNRVARGLVQLTGCSAAGVQPAAPRRQKI